MPPDATALSMTDPQPKNGPALSATSDMPEVKAEPPAISAEVNKTEAAKVEADAKAAADTAAAEAAKKPAEGEDPVAKAAAEAEAEKQRIEAEDPINSDKTPDWLKKLAATERNKAKGADSARKVADAARVAAEKKAEELSVNLTKALESIEGLSKAQAAQISKEAEKEDPQPSREAFDTPEAYDRALIDWSGRRAALVAKAEAQKEIETKIAEEKKAETDQRIKEDNTRVLTAFAERKAEFIKDHPDYEELVEQEYPEDRSKELQISIPMSHLILTDEDGPAIAYYLGKNPDEATRISKMPSPAQQVAALGRIAARLATKPVVSTKPAPLSTLKGGSETAVRKTADEESMAEYGARRQREIANEKRTRMGLPALN